MGSRTKVHLISTWFSNLHQNWHDPWLAIAAKFAWLRTCEIFTKISNRKWKLQTTSRGKINKLISWCSVHEAEKYMCDSWLIYQIRRYCTVLLLVVVLYFTLFNHEFCTISKVSYIEFHLIDTVYDDMIWRPSPPEEDVVEGDFGEYRFFFLILAIASAVVCISVVRGSDCFL